MSQICQYCNQTLTEGMMRCISCRMWNFPKADIDDEETVLLSDAAVKDGVRRLDVGVFSSLFGNTIYADGHKETGIAQSSVINIGGPPGAGKTTLFLMILDLIIPQVNREGMMIATEQSPTEICETARRIGVKNLGSIRIVKAMGGLRSDLGDMLLKFRPGFIVLDSLSKLVGEDLVMATRFAERFKEYSVEIQAPSCLVNQVNSGGEIAGRTAVQHAGDTTCFLDKDDSDGERFLYVTKNRFGEAPKGIKLWMSPEATREENPFEGSIYPGILIPKKEEEEDNG